MSYQRVLLVEDFCTFRRAIRTMLESHAEFQVVGEAEDGEAAIQLAAKLLPDIILLDINLPKWNGLQIMPQVLKLSPSSKIVFLTQEPSPEVAEEALRLGALGYVVKSDAGGELLKALEAIMREERYLSRRLNTQMTSETLQGLGITKAATTHNANGGIPGSQRESIQCAHEAQYYVHDSDFLESLQGCVSKALTAGDAVIVFLTLSHQLALCRRLQARGLTLNDELRTGRLRLVDAEATITGYLGDGLPGEARSREEAGLLIESADKARIGEHSRVCVFGECLSLLYARGKADIVLALERLWGELARTHNLYLRCWYQMSREQLKSDRQFFQKVCEEHTAVHSL
jgi:DNA-binding NarL/FixJ family response regulator